MGKINYANYRPRKTALPGRILALIKAKPDETWTPSTLAHALGLPSIRKVYQPLHVLQKAGLVKSRLPPTEYSLV